MTVKKTIDIRIANQYNGVTGYETGSFYDLVISLLVSLPSNMAIVRVPSISML